MRLDDVPRELLVALAVTALAWVAVSSARVWLRRHCVRRRFGRGREGEREAAQLLEASGFVVEGLQVVATYEVRVDDRAVPISVRADYVVTKGGERWVAEVKTGQCATRIENLPESSIASAASVERRLAQRTLPCFREQPYKPGAVVWMQFRLDAEGNRQWDSTGDACRTSYGPCASYSRPWIEVGVAGCVRDAVDSILMVPNPMDTNWLEVTIYVVPVW